MQCCRGLLLELVREAVRFASVGMRCRIAVLALALMMAIPGSHARAQGGLQDFPRPMLEEPVFQRKSAERSATQAAMLKSIQKGRLRGAQYHLRRLLTLEAYARYKQRPDLARKLRLRILEQRATIRTINSTM
jgi:hypothetical protein